MEKRRSKPAVVKSKVRRSVSDPAARLTSPVDSVKSAGSSSNRQPAIPNSKSSVSAAQKQAVTVSRPTSKAEKELEESESTAITNTSFTVLVRVLVAATKWRKMLKETTTKSALTKSLSLPPERIQPTTA